MIVTCHHHHDLPTLKHATLTDELVVVVVVVEGVTVVSVVVVVLVVVVVAVAVVGDACLSTGI